MGGKAIGVIAAVIAVVLGVLLLFKALTAVMGTVIFAAFLIGLFLLTAKMLRQSRR